MSEHGVVNCMNCRPPAFPGLVVAEADAEDAPVVEPDRSNQAVVARSIPPGRWRDAFEERAAILEFDGGLPRAVAEVRALAAVSGELRRELTAPFPKSESAARVEPTTCTPRGG